MGRVVPILAAIISSCLTMVCACNGSQTEDSSKPLDIKHPSASRHQTPSAELLPTELLVPPAAAKDEKNPLIPEDADSPGKLLAAARKALEDKRYMDAASIADVAVLLAPNEPEVFEIRGRALLASGDEEGAREDLGKCCALGLKSCCETGP